jgi:hypothetical protein
MDLKNYIQEHKSEFDDQKISAKTDASFETLLKGELHQKKSGKIVYIRFLAVAASLALLISSIVWFQSYQEHQAIKTDIISNLDNTSTGKRLEAVYEFSEEFKKEDQQIINVMIDKLLNDGNSNVKIAIIDALLEFPQNEKIRKSMIQALSQEVHPNVQIKLIKALSTLREQRAKEPLKEIINDENTFDIVKNNATLAMSNLKQ